LLKNIAIAGGFIVLAAAGTVADPAWPGAGLYRPGRARSGRAVQERHAAGDATLHPASAYTGRRFSAERTHGPVDPARYPARRRRRLAG
ncbi:MAG: hypothetical protein J7507_17100, partial [Pseudoxanthomonas sp.]|nr:hypothetical protein [Pseudoxanthomonas sp.]